MRRYLVALVAVCLILPVVNALAGEAEAPPPEAAKPPEEPKDEKKKAEEKKPDQEIVVTAARLPTPRERTGVSVTRIDAEDLAVAQDIQLDEPLRMIPGVNISQTGRLGDFTQIRTRGGESDHTLMLYDGFKVNQHGGPFTFDARDPVGAERIEIARGPGSSLFGADAVTGAVNVITAKGEGPPRVSVSGAAGTYRTDRETLDLAGSHDWFSYHVASSRLHSGERSYRNSEVDALNYAARFDFKLAERHDLKLLFRGVETEKGLYEDTDSFGFGPAVAAPDPDDVKIANDLLTGLEYRGNPLPVWETIVRAGRYEVVNEIKNLGAEPFGASRFFSRDWRLTGEWQNNLTALETEHVRDIVTVGVGAEYEQRKTETRPSFDAGFNPVPVPTHVTANRRNEALYFQNRLELYDRAFVTAGVRREENQDFGVFWTARGDASILIPESGTRIFGSVGNSFRAPSFFELFGGFGFGNPALQPEENFAYDAGIEQHFWNRRVTLSATWFHNDFKDLIAADGAGQAQNFSSAETRGFEFLARFAPLKQLELEATATLLRSYDDMRLALLRRPAQTYTGRLVARPLLDWAPDAWDGLDLSLEVLDIHNYRDRTPAAGRARNPGYTRVDFALSYRFWRDRFRAFARFSNIGDEKYQEVLTFPSDGASVLAGLEFTWRF
ncbi:MAG: TonB-dependent receptor [Planctomycetota bacterium]|nr:TonB-dependent receptor [Planctomycetota bacterium]